ncbi:MAG: hypothetical protein ACHQ1H_00740 [Nitrososphaerales archaeon]
MTSTLILSKTCETCETLAETWKKSPMVLMNLIKNRFKPFTSWGIQFVAGIA